MNNLLDPDKVGGDRYERLNEKIRVIRALLSRTPQKGGMPFIFAFSLNKPHQLDASIKCQVYKDPDTGREYSIPTAATDGKKYYWHPDALDSIDPLALTYIMCHETYHMIFQHTDPARAFGKHKQIWNWAVDYIVHTMIEQDVRNSQRVDLDQNFNKDSPAQYPVGKHPIWNADFGSPIYFDNLIANLKKLHKKSAQQIKAQNKPTKEELEELEKASLKNASIYADYGLFGKSAEDVYGSILAALPPELLEDGGDLIQYLNPNQFGTTADVHKDIEISRQELLDEVMEAAIVAERANGVGSVPASITDKLKELQEPKLSWQDLVRVAINKVRHDKGSKNDWSRYRRRGISYGMYLPKKKDDYVKWVAMLDTSGSMSNDDISYCVSQLKALDGRSEGIVVPVDAKPYWDKSVRIQSVKTDLIKVNPVGRGGTAFAEFFQDYEKKIGSDYDVMVVLTDGGIFDMEQLKPPKCDVVWVLCNDFEKFTPHFGRVAPMRNFK